MMNVYEIKPNGMTGSALAYLGDAVIELIARQAVLASGITDVGRLNALAADYVRATAQSRAFGRIEESLTEEEAAVYKRGRNAHGITVPKSASAVEYRRATGLEALFGYLFLMGLEERIYELFQMAFRENDRTDTTDIDEKKEE